MTDVPDTCIRCGEKLKPDDRFCERCGKAVEGKDDEADNNLEETKSVIDKLSKVSPLHLIAVLIIVILSITLIYGELQKEKSNQNPVDTNFGYWKTKGDSAFTKESGWADALQYFEKALEIRPTDSQTFLDKGNTLLRMGRLNESLNNLTEATDIDPYNYKAWQTKGKVYLQQHNEDDAVKCFDMSIEAILTIARTTYNHNLDMLSRSNETLGDEWENNTKNGKLKEIIP